MSEQTGIAVSSQEDFDARKVRRGRRADFTRLLAGILARAGVPVYRHACGAATVGLITGLFTPAERVYRQIHFLPDVAGMLRAPMADSLQLYLRDHARYARLAVMTTGQRCQLSEVGDRIIQLSRTISRWHHDVCKPLGIDVLFRSIEITIDADLTAHVHANVISNPTRYIPEGSWEELLKRTTAFFGAHWKDCGRLEDVREVVKYIVKGDDLSRLVNAGDDLVVELYHQLKGLHLVQPLGGFRVWRRGLEHDGLKLVSIQRSGRRRLVLVKRPPAPHRDRPAGAVDSVNHIYSISLPSALFTRYREPVMRVGRLDIETLWDDPRLLRRASEALGDWHHNGAPHPHQVAPEGHSPFQVHTDRSTVAPPAPREAPRPAETAAESSHAARAPPPDPTRSS